MYNYEHYYHIKTPEESVRFLSISRYTLDEIATIMDLSLKEVKRMLNIEDEDEGDEPSKQIENDTSTQVAIDPRKR